MMNDMKRLFTFLAVVILVAGTMAAESIKIGQLYYRLYNGVQQAEVVAHPDCGYAGVIDIPSTVYYNNTTYNVTAIRQSAFCYCERLTSVSIPASVKKIDDYAFNSENLTAISVVGNNPNYRSQDGVLFSRNMDQLICYPQANSRTSYVIPYGVQTIGEEAFMNCKNLKSITMPQTLVAIMQYAFSGCSGLSSLTLPSSLRDLRSGAFAKCSSLVSMTIPEGVPYLLPYLFSECTSLKTLTLPSSIERVEFYAFFKCKNISRIYVPKNERGRFVEIRGLKKMADIIVEK